MGGGGFDAARSADMVSVFFSFLSQVRTRYASHGTFCETELLHTDDDDDFIRL